MLDAVRSYSLCHKFYSPPQGWRLIMEESLLQLCLVKRGVRILKRSLYTSRLQSPACGLDLATACSFPYVKSIFRSAKEYCPKTQTTSPRGPCNQPCLCKPEGFLVWQTLEAAGCKDPWGCCWGLSQHPQGNRKCCSHWWFYPLQQSPVWRQLLYSSRCPLEQVISIVLFKWQDSSTSLVYSRVF